MGPVWDEVLNTGTIYSSSACSGGNCWDLFCGKAQTLAPYIVHGWLLTVLGIRTLYSECLGGNCLDLFCGKVVYTWTIDNHVTVVVI